MQRNPAIEGFRSEDAAALGFRAHTGWAAAVVVAYDGAIIERRRIAYEPTATRFIYHHAAEIPLDAAEALIGTARAEAIDKARQGIAKLISAIRDKTVIAAGVPGGNTRLPAAVPDILAAHSRIHAAEGAFYRDVLAEACALANLTVTRAPERDLWELAGKAAKCGEDGLRARLAAMGKLLGSPWAEDQKLATLAALIALK